MQVRDGRGRFTKSIVSLNKRVDSSQREVAAFVGHKKLIGGGLLKLEWVQAICPACGEQVEAVAGDGQVKGYCAVARQYVDFLNETQRVPAGENHPTESRTKISAALTRRHSAERRAYERPD